MDDDYKATPPPHDEALEELVRLGFVERWVGPDGEWWYRMTAAGLAWVMHDDVKESRN